MSKKIIGIIGCGVIGSALAEYAGKDLRAYIKRIVLCDNISRKAKLLAEKNVNSAIVSNPDELIRQSDLVIEAASAQIVPEVLARAFECNKDVLIMSIGGLLDCGNFIEIAEKKGIKLILPSGAVSGIDAIKSAKRAGIESVTLTTRKAPASLAEAPYLLEKKIDLDAIKKETVIFDGNARDAIKGFPKNINVSALVSIAGIGAEKTRVKIIVSPEYTRNIHEIEIVSKAGIITTRSENVPSPCNPKTSYLAVLAAIEGLNGYFSSVRIGT